MKDGYFESRFTFDKKRDFVWRSIAGYLQRYVDKNSSVLDLGAGYCNFINNIDAKEKIAVDYSSETKKYAGKNVKVFTQTCTNLKNLGNKKFDVVFSSNLFEHLKRKDFEKTIIEIKKILKKNGKLILIQPNFKYSYKEYFDDYTHKLIFTETSISDVLKANNFRIIKMVPRFIPFSMKSKAGLLYFLTPIYIRFPIKPLAKQMLIVAELDE